MNMKPQVINAPAIDIEPYLAKHLERLLRSCGFDIRSTPECDSFIKTLNQFVKYICGPYPDEIDAQLKRSDNSKTKDELISWTVSELVNLQAITLHKLERIIATSEMIQSSPSRIDCRMASSYTFRLSEIYQLSVAEWRANRAVEPASEKHKQKRRHRSWAPYLVDIFNK